MLWCWIWPDLGEAEEETHTTQNPQRLRCMQQHFLTTRHAGKSLLTGLLNEKTAEQ